MDAEPDIARLARTIGDSTRIHMLNALMEGRALTAKELAYGAGIAPATATAHLSKLENEGLVSATAQGRHKYYRLASAEVAHLIESLSALAPQPRDAAPKAEHPIRIARFCYDHLAGRLGTRLTEALTARGVLAKVDKSFTVTRKGESWFETFDIDLSALRRGRRKFAYPCLDWSERRDHLGGALGAALAQRLITLGWIEKNRRSRVVSVTRAGERALAREFDISLKQDA
jgi:DNA-binding transcriptional ArsR family regulator/ribosomal protein S19E (S16A)